MNAHEDGKCDKEVDSKAPDDHDLHSLIEEHHDTTFHISRKSQKTKLTTTELLAQVYGLKNHKLTSWSTNSRSNIPHLWKHKQVNYSLSIGMDLKQQLKSVVDGLEKKNWTTLEQKQTAWPIWPTVLELVLRAIIY